MASDKKLYQNNRKYQNYLKYVFTSTIVNSSVY